MGSDGETERRKLNSQFQMKPNAFPTLLVFDAVVAVTLKGAGVDTFYTRNAGDFRAFGLFEVIDPKAEG